MWSLPLLLLLLSSALAQTDLKVMVMGDWGQELTSSSRPNQMRVARAMGKYFEANPEVEFIISTGDNFYCCGVTSPDSIRFQNTWRDVYLTDEFPVMKSKRWYISVGNHDHTDDDDELNQVAFGDIEDQWYFPWLWYNFETVRDDFSVEFVAFDSQALRHNKHDRPAQQAFLDSTMGASTADYLIAFGHHPAENAGYHGGSGTIRDRVVPYMLTHHADVLVVGHDHNLQHITRANEEEHLDHIDYVITGAGGRALYSLNNANHNNLIQRGFELDFFVENFGFVIMNFAADKMSVDYYGLVGQDDYELVYSFDRENRRRNILNEKNSTA